MGARSLLGLDIGSRFVKAVELSESKGSLALTGYGMAEIPTPEATPDVVRDVLAHGGFRSKQTVTAVSGRSVIVRYITHARVPDEELPASMKYEIGKYIPFEPDDCYIDFQKLEEPGGGAPPEGGAAAGEMRVLLVAVKKEYIDEHVGLLEKLGLRPNIVDVDSFALGNAFEVRSVMNPAAVGDKVVALVDIGANKTNITIMKPASSYYFTREIYVAGNDFTEAIARKIGADSAAAEGVKRAQSDRVEEMKEAVSSLLEDLCHEIHLSFDYFETQFEREVDDIYVSGGGSRLTAIEEVFQRTFAKSPVRWNPTEFIPVQNDRINPAELAESSSQLAIAVGLASRIRKD